MILDVEPRKERDTSQVANRQEGGRRRVAELLPMSPEWTQSPRGRKRRSGSECARVNKAQLGYVFFGEPSCASELVGVVRQGRSPSA